MDKEYVCEKITSSTIKSYSTEFDDVSDFQIESNMMTKEVICLHKVTSDKILGTTFGFKDTKMVIAKMLSSRLQNGTLITGQYGGGVVSTIN